MSLMQPIGKKKNTQYLHMKCNYAIEVISMLKNKYQKETWGRDVKEITYGKHVKTKDKG